MYVNFNDQYLLGIYLFFFWLVCYYGEFLIIPLYAILLNRLKEECFRKVVLNPVAHLGNSVAHLEMTQGFPS